MNSTFNIFSKLYNPDLSEFSKKVCVRNTVLISLNIAQVLSVLITLGWGGRAQMRTGKEIRNVNCQEEEQKRLPATSLPVWETQNAVYLHIPLYVYEHYVYIVLCPIKIDCHHHHHHHHHRHRHRHRHHHERHPITHRPPIVHHPSVMLHRPSSICYAPSTIIHL